MKYTVQTLAVTAILFFSPYSFSKGNKGLELTREEVEAQVNRDPFLAAGYQQQEYMFNDIQGDLALLAYARMNTKVFKPILKRDKEGLNELVASLKEKQHEAFEKYKEVYKQWQFNLVDPHAIDTTLTEERIASFPISDKSKELLRAKFLGQNVGFELKSEPMVPSKVADMLAQVIHEEQVNNGTVPKIGEEHKFAPETLAYYKKEYPILKIRMTKIFMALGNGMTSRFMVTGKEESLGRIMEEQMQNSITLENAFRWSYQLNDGDVYLTLLTLENLFSYHWLNPQRESLAVVQRLSPFTHYFNKGDKFGHWYHFWGMVLYGYIRGKMQAKTVAIIEDKLSEMASKEGEIQEGKVNKTGAVVGSILKKFVAKRIESKDKFRQDPEYLKEEYYLLPMDLDQAILKKYGR